MQETESWFLIFLLPLWSCYHGISKFCLINIKIDLHSSVFPLIVNVFSEMRQDIFVIICQSKLSEWVYLRSLWQPFMWQCLPCYQQAWRRDRSPGVLYRYVRYHYHCPGTHQDWRSRGMNLLLVYTGACPGLTARGGVDNKIPATSLLAWFLELRMASRCSPILEGRGNRLLSPFLFPR